MLFLSLRTSFRRFWATILCYIWVLFWTFGHLGSFLRIALPCRRELKNQGPGVTEIGQKSNNKCIWLWDCFGEPVFKEIVQSGLKNAPKGTPNWTPKLAWCAARTSYFQPLVDKFVQVVPNGAQSDSKGVQRVPKWSQNAAQGLQNVGPKLAEKEKHRRKRKRKRRRRRKRKKQNKRKRTWNCQHITIYLQMGGIPLRYRYHINHRLYV